MSPRPLARRIQYTDAARGFHQCLRQPSRPAFLSPSCPNVPCLPSPTHTPLVPTPPLSRGRPWPDVTAMRRRGILIGLGGIAGSNTRHRFWVWTTRVAIAGYVQRLWRNRPTDRSDAECCDHASVVAESPNRMRADTGWVVTESSNPNGTRAAAFPEVYLSVHKFNRGRGSSSGGAVPTKWVQSVCPTRLCGVSARRIDNKTHLLYPRRGSTGGECLPWPIEGS